MNKRLLSAVLAVLMSVTLLTGCQAAKDKEKAETITVYLWSTVLYNKYAPYIQSQLPDVNIQFIVGQNDLDFYKFMNDNGALPDIIMCRRFSRHDALPLKEQLMDLSTTEYAGAVYETYLRDFTNSDGTINWLPMCGTADGIVANKGLFEKCNIPLPTDYDSFVYACQAFKELGIRGFMSDFIYDYTCMEILQGVSIPEITSMEGSMWRNSYEDPDREETGLDDTVWPVVFENMEQFIKDANLVPEDLEDSMDYGPICSMFRNEEVAMIRDDGSLVVQLNNEGIDAEFLPYFGHNGEQWILTYPEFQIALNKDLEQNESRKEKALRVLGAMLSEDAQKVLSNNEDVITYNKNVKLELSPYLENIRPLIEQNHLYIRVASNDFFSVSKDVVHKMIRGEYNAKQAYEAFDSQLRQVKNNESKTIMTLEKGYSNQFYTKGGSESYSVMANTIRNIYGGDVLIAPGFSFSGSVMASDYTEKQVTNMVLHGLFTYNAEMTGAQLKECVRGYVEGMEGGFKTFNRGSLPVVSGISIVAEEKQGNYRLLDVSRNGKAIKDDDIFKVVCLNYDSFMKPFLEKGEPVFEREKLLTKLTWTTYIKEGGTLAEPENYITVKVIK